MSVKSPCIDVCRMDANSGLCEGCLRTLDEIAGWAAATDEAKRLVLAAIAQRRTASLSPLQKSPLTPPFAKGGQGGISQQ
ncbi:MAG: DUF1289 domain-containing protein [Rhodocyclales bacterium]|nr:DUF1289 domain-containing protein [Rhodocyclales bacterium]